MMLLKYLCAKTDSVNITMCTRTIFPSLYFLLKRVFFVCLFSNRCILCFNISFTSLCNYFAWTMLLFHRWIYSASIFLSLHSIVILLEHLFHHHSTFLVQHLFSITLSQNLFFHFTVYCASSVSLIRILLNIYIMKLQQQTRLWALC